MLRPAAKTETGYFTCTKAHTINEDADMSSTAV